MTFFFLLVTVGVVFKFDLPGELSLPGILATITLFNLYVAELFLLFAAAVLFLPLHVVFRILLYALSFTFVVIYSTQLISLLAVNEYISVLALDNINHIGLLINWQSLTGVILIILVCLMLPLLIERRSGKISSGILRSIFTSFLFVVLSTSLYFSHFWLPDSLIKERDAILRKNYLPYTGPIISLLSTLRGKDVKLSYAEAELRFSKLELVLLKQFGFHFDQESEYPLVKKKVYTDDPPFPGKAGKTSTPNVLVFFTEGYSARGMTPYDSIYEGITPHLDDFSRHSMVVDNYYNHTGATYRGIHGQLCSLYPTYGGAGGWETNYDEIPDTEYLCLPEIFIGEGYETIFIDSHRKKFSRVDEMVTRLGFEHVITAEQLSVDHLDYARAARRDSLSDTQLYRGLVGLFKEREKRAEEKKPFFMGVYNLGTHAFIKGTKDGIKYGDGKNQPLNNIHTLDKAFGVFWEYFQQSSFAENTIVIFTTDHCHFPEVPFAKAFAGTDYLPFFVDRIPLIIYDPTRELPKRYDAKLATSVDFAPSLLHYLNIGNQKNPFLGRSIYRKRKVGELNFGVNSYGKELYLISDKTTHKHGYTIEYTDYLEIINKFIKASKSLELNNRIWSEEAAEQP